MKMLWLVQIALFFLYSCARHPVATQGASVITQPPQSTHKGAKKIIVLDPGHGGEDFGTSSLQKPWLHEKMLTLRTAKLVQGFLQDLGHEVLMTRKHDTFVPLLQRAAFANGSRCQLFVSIHYNSAPNTHASGIEIYFYHDKCNKIRTWRSERLAKKVLQHLIRETKARSRGVRAGDFAVIRETKMAAILIEAGFLSNRVEANKFRNPAYIKTLAYAIAKGIHDYCAPMRSE